MDIFLLNKKDIDFKTILHKNLSNMHIALRNMHIVHVSILQPTYMYLSDLKAPYFKNLSSISIMVISMGVTLSPSMARLALP